MTPEEHKRTSIFAQQLDAARRSASPEAPEPSEGGANAAEHADGAAASKAAATRRAAQALQRKQRSTSLPPAERAATEHRHGFFDDDITFWRATDAGALNAPLPRQAARNSAEPVPALSLGDAVEAAARGRNRGAMPPTPPVWRDETGALHRRPQA